VNSTRLPDYKIHCHDAGSVLVVYDGEDEMTKGMAVVQTYRRKIGHLQ